MDTWAWLLILIGIPIAWGFYKGYSGSSARSDPIGQIEGPGTYEIDIVGESHYQSAIERICGGRSDDSADKYVTARLVLEDDNKYDNNAVRVDIEGQTVGYLARNLAKEYRKRLIDAGHPRLLGVCKAVIVGGWDRGGDNRGHFGVKLDLPPGT